VLLAETVGTLAFLADTTFLHVASQPALVVATIVPAIVAKVPGPLARGLALLQLARCRLTVGAVAWVGRRAHTVGFVAPVAQALDAVTLGLLALDRQLARIAGALDLLVALTSSLGALCNPALLGGAVELHALGLLASLVVTFQLLALTLTGSLLPCRLFALLVAALCLLALDLLTDLLVALLLLAHRVPAWGLLTLALALDLLRALLLTCRLLTRSLLSPLLGLVVVAVFLLGVAAGTTTVLGAGSGAHAEGQGRTQRDRPQGLLAGGEFHVGSLLGLLPRDQPPKAAACCYRTNTDVAA